MTLADLFPIFVEELAGQSAANRRNYRTRLRLLLDLHGSKNVNEIMPCHLNEWHTTLKQRGYQPATLAGYRQAAKSFFNWLVDRGEISSSPAAHLKVGSFISRSQSRLPAEEEVGRCLNVARLWVLSRNPLEVRDGLIWLISYVSGCRLREIREMRLDEVERALRGSAPYWIRSHGKTGEVAIGIDEEVADAFRAWLKVRPACKLRNCFIGIRPTKTARDPESRYRPLTREGITEAYRRVSRAAGLDKAILSHALRHRKGDLVTRQQGPKVAARILNHKDSDTAATAIAYYHHPNQEDADQAILNSLPRDDHQEIARLFGIIP